MKNILEKLGTGFLFILIVIPWVLYWVYKKGNEKKKIILKQDAKVKKTGNKKLNTKEEIQSLSSAVKSAKSIIKNF